VFFSNFSKVWQLKTPKTTIFSHFIFWIHQWRDNMLFSYYWELGSLPITHKWIGMHLKKDESQIGSRWAPYAQIVEFECFFLMDVICQLKWLDFMKGWTVAWIQNNVSSSLLF
jgi:hypothetical protein